jgi:hypothetical protein
LPQFTELAPADINKILGIDKIDKEEYVIKFASDQNNIPEEFKDFK